MLRTDIILLSLSRGQYGGETIAMETPYPERPTASLTTEPREFLKQKLTVVLSSGAALAAAGGAGLAPGALTSRASQRPSERNVK
jgi:hypothetical protein